MRFATLFFVRHGVTDHTGYKLSGWMEGLDLTEEGREQARAAAAHIAAVRFKALYSSPIERCYQTAEVISETIGLPIEVRNDLGEVRYGRWTDRSIKSLSRTKLWEVLQRRPSAVRFPEGETLRDVQKRAVDEVEDIAARHRGSNVCVVTHSDVIRLVLAHYLGIHLDLYQRLVVDAASISVVSIGDSVPLVHTVNTVPRRTG